MYIAESLSSDHRKYSQFVYKHATMKTNFVENKSCGAYRKPREDL